MSRKALVAVVVVVLGSLCAAGIVQAAGKQRSTPRERADARALLAPTKVFKAAADARNADVATAIAAAESAAKACPPPAGVPTSTPASQEQFDRLVVAYTADLMHVLAAGLAPLQAEFATLRQSMGRLHLRTKDFAFLARDAVEATDELTGMRRVDLCAFWEGWKTDGLDGAKGFARLAQMVGIPLDSPRAHQRRYDRSVRHLRRVAGTAAARGYDLFPIAGRYAPTPLRQAVARLAEQYGLPGI
jgi:hypothetical protein